MAAFVRAEGGEPLFSRDWPGAVRAAELVGGQVLVWASKVTTALVAICSEADVPLLFMEDGFLRSKGLGSKHVEPSSLVIDRRGIYYDASRTCDLEQLLELEALSEEELEAARTLRSLIVGRGLSKYNVGQKTQIGSLPADREIILVAGQVGDDASIRRGTGTICTNLTLLRQVRLEYPDAFIIYKPHPDVELGCRWGRIGPHTVLRDADMIASDLAPELAIEAADRVCVMTSLLGFEALMRDKSVVCYGLPFYAGWGLTEDRMSTTRRTRKRSLDEVLAGAYIRYARYIDIETLQSSDALATARILIG